MDPYSRAPGAHLPGNPRIHARAGSFRSTPSHRTSGNGRKRQAGDSGRGGHRHALQAAERRRARRRRVALSGGGETGPIWSKLTTAEFAGGRLQSEITRAALPHIRGRARPPGRVRGTNPRRGGAIVQRTRTGRPRRIRHERAARAGTRAPCVERAIAVQSAWGDTVTVASDRRLASPREAGS